MTDAVQIRVSVDADAVRERFGDLAGQRLIDALAGGIVEAGEYGAGEVQLQARSRGIESRTGSLMQSIGSFGLNTDGDVSIMVGVPDDSPAAKYAYLLTDDTVTIEPVSGKWLMIPIGPNLTGAGVPRYGSPRDMPDGHFLRTKGRGGRDQLFYGITEYDGNFVAFFVGTKRVTVEGRDVIEPALDVALPVMTATVQDSLDALLAEDE